MLEMEQMSLSESAVQELEGLADKLRAEAERLRGQLEGVQRKLTDTEGRLDAVLKILPGGGVAIIEAKNAVQTDPRAYAEMGMREGIRAVLADFPDGLRPAAIASKLRLGGFFFKHDNSRLVARVGNDCWKMMKAGQLEKAPQRRYRLKKQEEA